MSPQTYKRIVLHERPVGDIEPTTFRTEILPFNQLNPGDGEVLMQVTWLSLDPAMRGYLRDVRSYLPPVKIGAVMRAMGLGVVIKAGKGSILKEGDNVHGPCGWTEYAVMKDTDLQKIVVPQGAEPLDFLNTLGTSGMTAYFGLKDIGELKAGETLVVSGAAGSVGSLACQLGKKAGAKVYAIAGSQDKCDWLEKEIGVDKAFNYKSPNFRKEFKQAGFVDVFFDNVGGTILDAVLAQLNRNARVVLCGAISAYNTRKPQGIQNYLALISQRAKLQGFIVFDYIPKYPSAIAEISRGLSDGSIKRKFHIVDGIEQAPVALPMLFNGGNTGKLVVRVSEPPQKAKL